MFNKTVLRGLLGFWVLWHLAFGLLATLSPETGAQISGWSPEGGWTTDLVGMSSQYGMVMVLLALVYAIAVVDPLRYLGLLWVAIGEQTLGIAYAFYIYSSIGNITIPQLAIQGSINAVVIVVFLTFWLRLRNDAELAYA